MHDVFRKTNWLQCVVKIEDSWIIFSPLLPKLNKIVKQVLSIALLGVFIYILYLQ